MFGIPGDFLNGYGQRVLLIMGGGQANTIYILGSERRFLVFQLHQSACGVACRTSGMVRDPIGQNPMAAILFLSFDAFDPSATTHKVITLE